MTSAQGAPSRRHGARTIGATAASNMAITGLSALSGLIIARQLGPAARGEYAAVMAWFGIALVVGEIGQPAAICFFVASDREQARQYIASSRTLMLLSGLITAAAGWFVSPLLAGHHVDMLFSFRLIFGACILSFISASFVFALQASSITKWNLVRASQPVLYLIVVVALSFEGVLTLRSAITGFVGTIAVQIGVAYSCCRRCGLTGGRPTVTSTRRLTRYGTSQLLANTPTSINARLDQLALSALVSYRSLGLYSVAVSVSTVMMPAVTAIGNVLFPRIAAQRDASTRLEARAVRASLIVASILMGLVAISSPWVVPFLFGRAFDGAARLVWVLAVGGIFLGSGQVIGDLLRGRGQPLAVAVGQGVGALLTIILLVALLPIFSIMGAAVASTLSYLATFIVLILYLRRRRPNALDTPARAPQSDIART